MERVSWRFGIRQTVAHWLRHEWPSLLGPVVLMYHRVVERIKDPLLDRWTITRKQFLGQLKYLTRYYRIISLDDAVDQVVKGETATDCVVLTFDDALTNVFEMVRPILRSAGIPYTVAVPTNLIGRGRSIWSLEVLWFLLHTPLASIRLCLGKHETIFTLTTRRQRHAAAQLVLSELYQVKEERRQQTLEALFQQQSEDGRADLPRRQVELTVMTQDQLRQLRQEKVTLAVHGASHIPLHDTEAEDVVHREVVDAKAVLENAAGVKIEYFVYPYGAAGRSAVENVHAAGYRAAFSTRYGCLKPGEDKMQLPRVAAECQVSHLHQKFRGLAYSS